MRIKFKTHSLVDVITNSSTTIYTYQSGCEEPAKELINEVLKLSGETEKTADDLFYFGVFLDNDDRYIEYARDNNIEGIPYPEFISWNDPNRKAADEANSKWIEDLQLQIMKGETERPNWFNDAESGGDYSWDPDTCLVIISKDEKYVEFAKLIQKTINGVSADGGMDG